MISIYKDVGGKKLASSQAFNIDSRLSALWIGVDRKFESDYLLSFIASAFNDFNACFWCAMAPVLGTPKMLEIKRVFGHYGISKADIVFSHSAVSDAGEKYYSDLAEINSTNFSRFSSMIKRSLFGIDSSVLFIPVDSRTYDRNFLESITRLYIRRCESSVLMDSADKKSLLNQYLTNVIGLGGVATLTLRDSDMGLFVVAVGDSKAIDVAKANIDRCSKSKGDILILDGQKFDELTGIGLSISILS